MDIDPQQGAATRRKRKKIKMSGHVCRGYDREEAVHLGMPVAGGNIACEMKERTCAYKLKVK